MTMGASDGFIGAVAKVVDHGPTTARWNLVILGDGYRSTELTQYHTDVQNFLTTLRATPPYDDLWCGINVFRIDVVSTDSGADDPASCPDAPGSGATAATFFDATFCSTGPGGVRLSRLLTVDSTRAQQAANSLVDHPSQVMVIVNSSKYGGSGGQVAVCSTNTSAAQIAIHEIGHSYYELADEYGGNGVGTPPGEPPKPNVTRDTNRATNKWRVLIAPTTPMPSACGAGCSDCTPPATPPAPGAVGTYEGGMYADCGIYRPLPDCKMRTLSAPFCPVCAGVIRNKLSHFQPPESIMLVTPSISFTDVPEGIGGGVTTWRAVTFEVVACRDLHFEMIAGPTGGFGTPQGRIAQSRKDIVPVDRVHLWLSYTSTTAGSVSTGSVTVRCNETGQTWPINISANTVARPRSAISLVLDHSGSMSEDAGDATTKVQKLREAVQVFVDAMLPGDGIGLVRFDDTVQRLMNVTDVGPLGTGAGRQTAINTVNGPQLDPAGGTSIGGGVQEGKHALDDVQASSPPPYDVTAMLILTDGNENTPPMIADVSSSITANTFAVGLGLPSNISVGALNSLTQGHNGYLVVTGSLTQDQQFYLSKYFLQILAGITNANVVVDPPGELGPTDEHRIPFTLCEADYGIDAYLLSPAPQYMEFALETPDGSRIDLSNMASFGTVERVTRGTTAFYRASLPAIPADSAGSHSGTWSAILSIGSKRQGWSPSFVAGGRRTLPYELIVHAYSNLIFSARALQTSYEPGAQVHLYAALKEYDVPVERRAIVWADIAQPNGALFTLPMVEQQPGNFTAIFVTSLPGVYRARVRAHGQTVYGRPFTREQTVTAVAVVGGDRPTVKSPPDTIGDLLCCLLRTGALTPETIKRVLPGLDPTAVFSCLRGICARRSSPQGESKRGELSGPSSDLDLRDVASLIRDLARRLPRE
jgi:hypothetical protein